MPGQEGIMPISYPDSVRDALSTFDLGINDMEQVAELVAQTMWYSGDTLVNPGIAKTLCQGIVEFLGNREISMDDLTEGDARLIEKNYQKIFHDPKNKQLAKTEKGLKKLAASFTTSIS